jgi:hypothetical protein
MDSDVGRDGEEGYNLREMGSDGQGGWEEGGVDGSAGGGVSATAAAMEWSMSGVGGNSTWSVEKRLNLTIFPAFRFFVSGIFGWL